MISMGMVVVVVVAVAAVVAVAVVAAVAAVAAVVLVAELGCPQVCLLLSFLGHSFPTNRKY